MVDVLPQLIEAVPFRCSMLLPARSMLRSSWFESFKLKAESF
jgi:hypothetical protein